MDVLSLAANIAAVADAATKAAKGVEAIRTLFKPAPVQLLQLLNEISDIRTVVALAHETCSQFNSQGIEPTLVEQLNHLIGKIGKTLEELNDMLKSVLSNDAPGQTKAPRISWKAWLKARKEIGELSSGLRRSRQELTEGLTVLTSSQIPLMRIGFRDIALATENIQTSFQSQQTNSDRDLENLTTEISSINSKLEVIQESLRAQAIVPGRSENEQLCSPEHGRVISGAAPDIAIRTKLYHRESCGKHCRCRCHSPLVVESPKWIINFLGRLLIGYSGGLNLFRKRPCSEGLCRPKEFRVLTVTYWFPAWFLGRSISIRDHWTPFLSHSIRLRTPRVRGPDSETVSIFHRCEIGDMRALQIHFENGRASPYDTELPGCVSLLQIAIDSSQSEMCKFLIDQGADVHYRDIYNSSVIDYVWDVVLSNEQSQSSRALKDVFDRFLDIDEFITDMELSPVHCIVLGLAPKDISLRSYLQLTTADINAKDSAGRTPLLWAAIRGNADATRTLIAFGADLYIPDMIGRTPLQYALWYGPSGMREVMGELIHAYEMDDSRPLGYGVNFIGTEYHYGTGALHIAAILGRVEEARILLDHYACVDSMSSSLMTPLMHAVWFNHREMIELLLDRGARMDAKDAQDMSLLHYAAKNADLETLKLLTGANLTGLCSKDKDEEGHTPREFFKQLRHMHIEEDDENHMLCKGQFELLLSKVEAVNKEESAGQSEERLHEDPVDSDDDEFFDASSSIDIQHDGSSSTSFSE